MNAHDAGITMQPSPNPAANLRLVQFQLESGDAARELRRMAELLQSSDPPAPPESARPEVLFQFERALLNENRILPLVYLRQTFALSPHVHVQGLRPGSFTLHLENAWLEP